MAASNFTPISLYHSTAASAVPTAGNLVNGELAINITDGKLYFKNNAGVVTLLAQAGGGGVTSFSAGTTGLTPSTATTGAVTLAGTLAAVNGGTGQSTYGVGDLLVGGAGNTLNKLADVTTGNALISGGVGNPPTYGKIGLLTHVTGTLTIFNGGTGQTTANAAYNALSPMTTTGDMEYRNASSVATRLPIGSTGQALTVSGGIPTWGTVAIAGGGTGQTTASAGFNALSPITSTGDLIIGNGVNSATRLAIGTNNTVLISNGTTASWGAAPAGSAATPTALGTVYGDTDLASPFTTALGYQASNATTGVNNTAVGHQALLTNSSGTDNTAVGFNSLKLTNGNYNSALGSGALQSVSTGSQNTAIGANAGSSITTGNNNVCVGILVNGNAAASGSVGIGFNVGIGANQNVSIGYDCYNQTVGQFNVSIGKGANRYTTGSNTVVIGNNACNQGNSAGNVVYIGNQAAGNGASPSTGGGNTGVGDTALYVITSGSNTTALGYNAGSTLTTGTNNVCIGYNSTGSSATVSNEFTHGNASITSNRFWGDMKMAGANAGTSGQVLTSAGPGVSPTWGAAPAPAAATPTVLGTVFGTTTTSPSATGLGPNALLNNTGNGVTAVGNSALKNNTSGFSNTAVGTQALELITTGSNCTAVGNFALSGTGSNNTAIGQNAGFSLSTGTNNTIVGRNAQASSGTVSNEATWGNSSTTSNRFWGDMKMAGANAGTSGQVLTSAGAGVAPTWTTPGGGAAATATTLGTVYGVTSATTAANVAYGYDAGVGSSAGLYNTVIGNRANRTMPSGTNSQYTAIGFEALNNSSGAAMAGPCTAIGYQAMGAMTQSFPGYGTAVGFEALKNGSYASTAVGHQALALDAGNNNCAFGYLALSTSTASTSNSAFGNSSLAALTTASSNSAFGASSLAAVTTGGNNSSFGNGAGSNITTGTNNTVIGYSAQATSATVSNEITLGNSSIATLRCQVTTITALSDARDKKDITPLQAGIEFIKKLNPVNFIWNMRDGGKVDIADAGFIAQELKQAQIDTGITIPNLVFEGNPDRLEAGYGALLPVLVKAIQELNAKVEVLESQLKEKQ